MNPTNPPNIPSIWETQFARNRGIARMRLRRLQKHIRREPWIPSDGEGKELTKSTSPWTLAQWKTIYQLWDPIKEGRWPPKNVQLSDCWVYLAVKLLSPKERAAWYSADFDLEGNIRPSRVPCGNPVVVYAHGLYCLPVYKHSYVLCGEALASYGNWILGSPRKGKDAGSRFMLGLVCVPPEVIPKVGPNIERYLFFHNMANQWDLNRKETEDWVAAEAHSGTFDRWCLANTDKATMLYSTYPNADPNYAILPVRQVNGFTAQCNALCEKSSQLMQPEPVNTTGNMFAAHNGVFGLQFGNAMAGPSNWQFANTNYINMNSNNGLSNNGLNNNGHHEVTIKEEPLSPAMTTEEFLAIPLAAREEQGNTPTLDQFLIEWQSTRVKTEGSPPPTTEVERALATWMGTCSPNMDDVRRSLENYVHYLRMDPGIKVADVEAHAGFLYNYLRSLREMQESDEGNTGN